MSVEKKFNKLLLGLVIGGAVAGAAGLSKTEKGKEITKKVGSKTLDLLKHTVDFLKGGLDEMSKKMGDDKKDETPPTLPDNSGN